MKFFWRMTVPDPEGNYTPGDEGDIQKEIDEVKRAGLKFSGSRDAVRDRRNVVKEMLMRQVPPKVIAKTLGVGIETIREDMKVIRKEIRRNVKELDVLNEIGEKAELFDVITKESIALFYRADSNSDKDRFLNTAMRSALCKLKLLMDTGYLPTAPIGMRSLDEDFKSVGRKFTDYSEVLKDPSSRRRVMDLFKKLMLSTKKDIKALGSQNGGGSVA